jgi:predicted nuclease of restriction endonuclease-like (RecB) superfamily
MMNKKKIAANYKLPLGLLKKIANLIEESKAQTALAVNRELTILYWRIGKEINNKILRQQRGEYGEGIIVKLSEKLTIAYGKGWSKRHLWNCARTACTFDEDQVVNELSIQLSWTHLRELAEIEDEFKRTFYTQLCIRERWSTRVLEERIGSMLYERTALSKKPKSLIKKELKLLKNEGPVTPDLVFRDPYVLNFLGLKNIYDENDLETAILLQLQHFIIELGNDFAFIARQKRILIDKEDYKIDLLFFHRGLKRLIAIDLKLDRFKAAYKGQMELYLKWLDKYEKKEGEEPPIGLILCSEKQQEQIELLELNNGRIRVSQYLTQLPSKKLLVQKLNKAINMAKVTREASK